jgi:cyclophilin family peptidyl-prolyl cis-trans isomerase
MANKKKPIKNTKTTKKSAQADPNMPLRIGALVVLALAVIGIIYLIVSGLPKQTSTSQASGSKTGAKQYASAPAMQINKTRQYFATVKMAKGGEFVIQLYPDKAPITVNSFVFLAKDGYFNGVTFHRVLEGFMAQGGDPTGTGNGGPGYEFVNEDSDLTFDKAGVVAMANAGRDTNGSQFFITFGPTQQLNGGYTIFGQVISGMDVVNAITRRDPEKNPTFTGDVMESVTITEK